MSDERFVCPEPSAKALAAHNTRWNSQNSSTGTCIAAAYAVDVPGIVRREVERALGAMALKGEEEQSAMKLSPRRVWWDGNGAWRRAYLAARFGEAAPEGCRCIEESGYLCRDCGADGPTPDPTPSATAELIDATPQPLDRKVERMERFLTALAQRYTTRDNHTRTLAAAREYLRP